MLCLCGVLLHSQKPQPAKETDLFETLYSPQYSRFYHKGSQYADWFSRFPHLYIHLLWPRANHSMGTNTKPCLTTHIIYQEATLSGFYTKSLENATHHIPPLLEIHFKAFRNSKSKLSI